MKVFVDGKLQKCLGEHLKSNGATHNCCFPIDPLGKDGTYSRKRTQHAHHASPALGSELCCLSFLPRPPAELQIIIWNMAVRERLQPKYLAIVTVNATKCAAAMLSVGVCGRWPSVEDIKAPFQVCRIARDASFDVIWKDWLYLRCSSQYSCCHQLERYPCLVAADTERAPRMTKAAYFMDVRKRGCKEVRDVHYEEILKRKEKSGVNAKLVDGESSLRSG